MAAKKMHHTVAYVQKICDDSELSNRRTPMPIPPIGLVAPTVEVAMRAQSVARELNMQEMLEIRVANHYEGVETARRFVEDGIEVIISRRSTTVLIEEALQVTSISIPITMQDLTQALRDARRLTGLSAPRTAVFVMPMAQSDIESFAHYLDLDLHIYPVTPDEEYLAYMVDRAIAEKMVVIVAGTVVTFFANKKNFPSVLLDSGQVALKMALEEARRVAYARKLEKTQAEHFRIVVNTAYNGIIVVDAEQVIQMANPAACGIVGQTVEHGMPVHELLPELDLAPSFASGESMRNIFLRTRFGPLVLDATPTKVGSMIRGAVITFQPAEAINELGANTRNNLFSQGFGSHYDFSSIIGETANMRSAKSKAREYAKSTGAVLLVGETGTGKELFAHAIHAASPRASGPFVPVNCAAIPSTLLESELFGYEEGAFTGAIRKGKPGLFEQAHQGTIFLDEISEMSTQAQLRLLRVLQERRLMRLGGRRIISLDIRIIAATNKNLQALVNSGKFRKDLYYRLNVLPLFIPPLRLRVGDIPLLAQNFLRQGHRKGQPFPSLGKNDIKKLEAYPWEGNVRELQNVIERFSLAWQTEHSPSPDMGAMLAPDIGWESLDYTSATPMLPLSPEQHAERERIALALRRHEGRRAETALHLGMNRTTLFRKMTRYGLL